VTENHGTEVLRKRLQRKVKFIDVKQRLREALSLT
jgi:hypothetical protein